MVEDLTARLNQLGLDGKLASVKVRNCINVLKDGERVGDADAFYLRRVIELSLAAGDKKWAFDHEVIHALREMGLFTDLEWRTLESAAVADKARMASVPRAYPDLSDPDLIEEALANMFAGFAAGRRQPKGFIRKAFDRVIALRSFGEALCVRRP